MEVYHHVLIARHIESHQCHANDGELLIAASPLLKTPVKVRQSDHFFVGLESGKPSLYGWVEAASKEITTEELVEKVLASPARDKIGSNREEIEAQVLLTYKSVNRIKPGSIMLSDFYVKYMETELTQKVHKIIVVSLRGK